MKDKHQPMTIPQDCLGDLLVVGKKRQGMVCHKGDALPKKTNTIKSSLEALIPRKNQIQEEGPSRPLGSDQTTHRLVEILI